MLSKPVRASLTKVWAYDDYLMQILHVRRNHIHLVQLIWVISGLHQINLWPSPFIAFSIVYFTGIREAMVMCRLKYQVRSVPLRGNVSAKHGEILNTLKAEYLCSNDI